MGKMCSTSWMKKLPVTFHGSKEDAYCYRFMKLSWIAHLKASSIHAKKSYTCCSTEHIFEFIDVKQTKFSITLCQKYYKTSFLNLCSNGSYKLRTSEPASRFLRLLFPNKICYIPWVKSYLSKVVAWNALIKNNSKNLVWRSEPVSHGWTDKAVMKLKNRELWLSAEFKRLQARMQFVKPYYHWLKNKLFFPQVRTGGRRVAPRHFHILLLYAGTPGEVQGQLWKCFFRSKGNRMWDGAAVGHREEWARREGGAGVCVQESLQMWYQSQSLGSGRAWHFYSGRRRGGISSASVWNIIFPFIRDFWITVARQSVSSATLQESRGTRTSQRHMAHIMPHLQHQSLSHHLCQDKALCLRSFYGRSSLPVFTCSEIPL